MAGFFYITVWRRNGKVIKLSVNHLPITIHLIFAGLGSCVLCFVCFYTAHLFCSRKWSKPPHTTQPHRPTSKKEQRTEAKTEKNWKSKHKNQKKLLFCQTDGWLMNDVHGIFMILWVGFLWRVCFGFFPFFRKKWTASFVSWFSYFQHCCGNFHDRQKVDWKHSRRQIVTSFSWLWKGFVVVAVLKFENLSALSRRASGNKKHSWRWRLSLTLSPSLRATAKWVSAKSLLWVFETLRFWVFSCKIFTKILLWGRLLAMAMRLQCSETAMNESWSSVCFEIM